MLLASYVQTHQLVTCTIPTYPATKGWLANLAWPSSFVSCSAVNPNLGVCSTKNKVLVLHFFVEHYIIFSVSSA